MRYALIDNSTLTGVQRLLGEIPVKNTAIVDNDIIAFENYIQAILFYDSLICIDDYKEKFRAKRIASFPDIRFISKDLFDYDYFANAANKVTKDITLEIRGGQISDSDFKSYFERMQMTYQFTWDMSSSEFFLTQKMLLGNDSILDHESFNILNSLLFIENNEQYDVSTPLNNKKPKLYDSRGREIIIDSQGRVLNSVSGDGLSPQFKAMVSSLNWISQRTAFYVLVAEYLCADLFLQPLRQSFMQNIIKRTHPSYNLGTFNTFRESINRQSVETLNNVLKNSDNFGITVNIPLFSASFAKKTKDSQKIIQEAYNERESKCFIEARNNLREIYVLLENDNRGKYVREINLLSQSINKTFKSIESKYGLGESQGFGSSQLKLLLSFIPATQSLELPKFQISKLEPLKHIIPKKGFNAVYRDVVEDLINFQSLGKYKDILLGNIKYDKSASLHEIKTEDPQYVRSSSYWKKPM